MSKDVQRRSITLKDIFCQYLKKAGFYLCTDAVNLNTAWTTVSDYDDAGTKDAN